MVSGVTRCFWQVAVLALCVGNSRAVAAQEQTDWKPVTAAKGGFANDLAMLDSERDEYATYLANHSVVWKQAGGDTRTARRMISLALHLSPRNKRAVVVNYQLSRGITPENSAGTELGAPALARLLLMRGRLLEKQEGGVNAQVSRWFVALAAELDPKNEDAVYASEIRRIDGGEVDWKPLDAPAKEE